MEASGEITKIENSEEIQPSNEPENVEEVQEVKEVKEEPKEEENKELENVEEVQEVKEEPKEKENKELENVEEVQEEGKIEKEENAEEEVAPCSEPENEVCQCQCNCPFRSEESVKEYVEKHSLFFENVQGMIFWRRPIPFALLLTFIEAFFIYVKICKLSFYQVICLIAVLYIGIKECIPGFKRNTLKVFFPPLITNGFDDEPNRIRNNDEVSKFIWIFVHHIKLLKEVNIPDTKKIVYLAVAFLVFWKVGTFWTFYIIQKIVMVLPGIYLYPPVYRALHPYMQKIVNSMHKESVM